SSGTALADTLMRSTTRPSRRPRRRTHVPPTSTPTAVEAAFCRFADISGTRVPLCDAGDSRLYPKQRNLVGFSDLAWGVLIGNASYGKKSRRLVPRDIRRGVAGHRAARRRPDRADARDRRAR